LTDPSATVSLRGRLGGLATGNFAQAGDGCSLGAGASAEDSPHPFHILGEPLGLLLTWTAVGRRRFRHGCGVFCLSVCLSVGSMDDTCTWDDGRIRGIRGCSDGCSRRREVAPEGERTAKESNRTLARATTASGPAGFIAGYKATGGGTQAGRESGERGFCDWQRGTRIPGSPSKTASHASGRGDYYVDGGGQAPGHRFCV